MIFTEKYLLTLNLPLFKTVFLLNYSEQKRNPIRSNKEIWSSTRLFFCLFTWRQKKASELFVHL